MIKYKTRPIQKDRDQTTRQNRRQSGNSLCGVLRLSKNGNLEKPCTLILHNNNICNKSTPQSTSHRLTRSQSGQQLKYRVIIGLLDCNFQFSIK